jgi:D-sedoheptulose 7-phosphate isomerase
MSEQHKEQILNAIKAHKILIAEFEQRGISQAIAAAEAITQSIKQGGTVYICGNGGSAADAQHIAAEFVGRFERERKALAAVALTTDTSIISSVSNDYGYEHIFKRQVEALVSKNDILWAISTSGTSTNIIAAVESAKEIGATILAFTGKSQSRLEELSDICFSAGSDSTARSQELHQLAYHIICDLVEQNFCES